MFHYASELVVVGMCFWNKIAIISNRVFANTVQGSTSHSSIIRCGSALLLNLHSTRQYSITPQQLPNVTLQREWHMKGVPDVAASEVSVNNHTLQFNGTLPTVQELQRQVRGGAAVVVEPSSIVFVLLDTAAAKGCSQQLLHETKQIDRTDKHTNDGPVQRA